MRVIAGSARSLPLVAPSGNDTRPTTDRIKETLFNMIQLQIPNCIFCDFFSGSGGIGIEAISRGAKKSYFVDNNKEALSCIKKNIEFTKFTDKAMIIGRDVRDAIYQIHDTCDIIFMDPPYSLNIEFDIMKLLLESDCIDNNTIIIIEAEKSKNFDNIEKLGFHLYKEKIYKSNKHVFFRVNDKA